MIKRILPSIATWIGMLVLLLTVMIVKDNIMAFILIFIWLLLPIINFIFNIFAAKKISVNITTTATTSKNKRAVCNIELRNAGFLPIIRAYCFVEITNRLTGEIEKLYVPISAFSQDKGSKQFEITSLFCGYIKLSVNKLYIMDLFGILPWKINCMAKAGVCVYPDTFAPTVYLNVSMSEKEDAQKWSQYEKGNDQSELFALREYIPGDSLKQIHWKMSAKKQQLIVKESSLPVEKSLLVFWNKNTEKSNAQEMDAMAEVVSSVALAIMDNGVPFTLGWTEEMGTVFESMDTKEQLQQAIPRMIKRGYASVDINIPYEERSKYNKIIYIAKSLDDTIDIFQSKEKKILLCTTQNHIVAGNAIVFQADRYAEDLQFLEL